MVRRRVLTVEEVWRKYDRSEARLTLPVSERMVDLAGLRPGMRVLDLATGRGEPAILAAHRVTPGGYVLGIDCSASMLEMARERATMEDASNLELRALNAESLDGVPTANFHATLVRWGLMYMDLPVAALTAARHAMVPHGVLVAAVWAEPERVPYFTLPRRVLEKYRPLPQIDPDASGTFRYADPDRLYQDLSRAGFRIDRAEEMDVPVMEAETGSDLIEWARAFGLTRLLNDLPNEIQLAWENDLVRAAEPLRTDGLIRLGGVTRIVVASAALTAVRSALLPAGVRVATLARSVGNAGLLKAAVGATGPAVRIAILGTHDGADGARAAHEALSSGSYARGWTIGIGTRVRSGVNAHEDFKRARGTPVTLAAEAANADRSTATAWTRPMCDRHDGRKLGSVRSVLRQGAGVDGRVGATEVARLAGSSLGDVHAIGVARARLVVARCHDDLRVRVRAATGVESDFTTDRVTPAIRKTLYAPTGRAASDALPASHLALATASVQHGGGSPVRRARVRACAAAPRLAREHGYQAEESQLESQNACHARQESTLRARPSAPSFARKNAPRCVPPCAAP